jgi:flagella basal body P-ring formation protein FlgA
VVAGHETESLDVIADVSLYADVVAPTRMLKPDELIEPDDVGLVRVRVNGVPHHFLVNPEEAIGKSPGKVLQPQMPIRGSSLVKPFIVRKGDRVTIEARRGGLSIQATGITKAAAQLGQYVTVTNQDSGKEVRGRVAGPGLVRVEF